MSLGYWETLATSQGAGTALAAAAAASLLQGAASSGLYTLTPNRLKIGDAFHVRASGQVSSAVTTPGTYRWGLTFGAVANVFDSTAIAPLTTVQTNIPWILDIEGIVRTLGAGTSATIFWQGLLFSAALSTTLQIIAMPVGAPPVVGAGFDSTVSNLIDLRWTQTVATGSVTLHNYSLSLKSSSGF